jgi:MFS transporter, DHA1 family, inner membrane transport protein
LTQQNKLLILVFTAALLVMNIMIRLPYAFLPVLARGLGVEVSVFTAALGARSFASASGPFLASVSDRRGRKFGMVLAMVIFLAGLGLVISLPVYPAFIAALLLTSIGKAAFDPAMQAFIGDRIPYSIRGRAIGITELGWSLSILIGVPLMGLAIKSGGWPAPFPILFVLGVACLLAILLIVPKARDSFHQSSGLIGSFRIVLGSRTAIAVLLAAMLMCGANEAVNLTFAVWIDTSFSLQLAALGAASLVIGLAELGGESLVLTITDRIGKLRSVQLGIFLNCLAALALPLLSSSLPAFLMGLFFFYLTFEFSLVSLIPMVTEVLPGARATLLAFNVTFIFLGRALVALIAIPFFSSAGLWGMAVLSILINTLAFSVLLIFQRRPESVF